MGEVGPFLCQSLTGTTTEQIKVWK